MTVCYQNGDFSGDACQFLRTPGKASQLGLLEVLYCAFYDNHGFCKTNREGVPCPPTIILLDFIVEAAPATPVGLQAVAAVWAVPATTAGSWSVRHRRERCAAPDGGAPRLLRQRR